jgi:hypothetical protein
VGSNPTPSSMTDNTFTAHDITITVDHAESDGTVVVFIDTPSLPEDSEGPFIRVYLNDGIVFENPPFGEGHADEEPFL